MPRSERELLEARRLLVRGQVQGVGFRPFVYRLARQCRLTGHVCNDATGVYIEIEGRPDDLLTFQTRLRREAPAAAVIDACESENVPPTGTTSFVVAPSRTAAQPLVRLPRDAAVCADCIADVEAAGDRRHGYPFTSCTVCGPRFSILTALPYDRAATSMREFPLCRACNEELHTPDDRRFHAQSIACPTCGPEVALWDRAGRAIADRATAVERAVEALRRGDVVAVKGLGGFQLLGRADDAATVRRLRHDKRRPRKPLAVMVPHLDLAESLARVGADERRLLRCSENPIVLCDVRPGRSTLAEEVAPHTGTLGLFLPTTPLHHVLLARLGLPVIATSGNVSEEPIVHEERAALARLAGIADVFLVHNRPIVRRLDDSVVRVVAGKPTLIRLSRGYAPLPLPALEALAARRSAVPALALGGHQKAALALWTGTQAVLGQHIGDLDHPDTRTVFAETVRDLCGLYGTQPRLLACDLHPDYFTTRWASEQAQPVRRIQHHHAHAAACMVEHGLLDDEVLALTWDGTGFGPDGVIWGGEILRASLHRYERVATLLPFPLPGGELAVRQPARSAFGLLYVLLGETALLQSDLLQHLRLTTAEAQVLVGMIRRGVNCPWTTSMGRLFDGIAALVLGALTATYEGEAAIWLESVADANETASYPLPFALDHKAGDWRHTLAAILDDLQRDSEPARISARFHQALADWACAAAALVPRSDVVLSGGCFQNRLLTERVASGLRPLGRRVHVPGLIPANDGGLAVGQLAIALAQ